MTLTVVTPDDVEDERCRMHGLETRWEMDGFLKSHGVYEDYAMEDFEQERRALKDVGFKSMDDLAGGRVMITAALKRKHLLGENE